MNDRNDLLTEVPVTMGSPYWYWLPPEEVTVSRAEGKIPGYRRDDIGFRIVRRTPWPPRTWQRESTTFDSFGDGRHGTRPA